MRDLLHRVKEYNRLGVNLRPGGFVRHRAIRPSIDRVRKVPRRKREYTNVAPDIHRLPDVRYIGADPPPPSRCSMASMLILSRFSGCRDHPGRRYIAPGRGSRRPPATPAQVAGRVKAHRRGRP